MIFNCENCGISISTNRITCPFCKKNNSECIEMLTGTAPKNEKALWKERVKGSILSYVLRQT
jgi:ABC-type ATPase with predicted acetyltransferase domain